MKNAYRQGVVDCSVQEAAGQLCTEAGEEGSQ
jgi:hypothetical protein